MKNIMIAGLGRGAAFAAATAKSDKVKVVGLIDADQRLLEECADAHRLKVDIFTNLDQALKKDGVDLLIIATPTRLHPEHSIAAMKHGLHVLCEKPMANTRKEAMAMLEASQQTGRKLAVVQNMRYLPMFRKCRELVRNGAIGKLCHVELNFRRWRPPRGLNHAVLLNHGVHHMDCIRSIVADEPLWINAVEWDPGWTTADQGTGRFVRLTIALQGGCFVSYNASYGQTGRETPQSGRLRIIGSDGAIEVYGEPDFDPQVWLSRNKRATGREVEERVPVERCSWRDVDKQIVEEFVAALENGQASETDISDNIKTLEWLYHAVESIETGVRILYKSRS